VTSFQRARTRPRRRGVGPRFSPDGGSLAYLRSLDESFEQATYGVPAVAVSPAGGGEARLLTKDRNAQALEWSPDGRSLYFALEDDRSVQLARVPAGGGPVERLTERGARG
jgi:Tol biopolymer transport system component